MINEYDMVNAARDLNEKVLSGCIGTVVMVYENPSLAYEVEFFGSNDETIAILTVKPDEIIKV
jgi:hypothetical protein